MARRGLAIGAVLAGVVGGREVSEAKLTGCPCCGLPIDSDDAIVGAYVDRIESERARHAVELAEVTRERDQLLKWQAAYREWSDHPDDRVDDGAPPPSYGSCADCKGSGRDIGGWCGTCGGTGGA